MVDLTVNFDTLHQLYRAYMPFIQPAGLFVATTEGHFLGQEIQIGYRLPGSTHVNEFQGSWCGSTRSVLPEDARPV